MSRALSWVGLRHELRWADDYDFWREQFSQRAGANALVMACSPPETARAGKNGLLCSAVRNIENNNGNCVYNIHFNRHIFLG